MKRLVLIGASVVVTTALVLLGAFSAFGNDSDVPQDPFSYVQSDENDGPGSSLWGDGGSGPSGVHLGCIPGRRWALAIVVENGTSQPLTILSVGGSQAHARVIRRVAVQFRPKPARLPGDHLLHAGIRSRSSTPGEPLAVPASSGAWLQLNFAMGKCSLIKPHQHLVVSDPLTITYQDSTGAMGRGKSAPIFPIILTRATKAQITAYRANPDAG